MSSSDDAPSASASRLILLPDTDDHDPLQEYPTDDDDDSGDDVSQPGVNPLSVPPLPPSVVFLYLLSPYLRLGAIYASDIAGASLAYALVALVVAASLSLFCRHIWFLLGRYTRKSFTEDILVHAFARRHRRVRKYGLARHTLTIISGSFRLLLAAMYLRASVETVLLLQASESLPLWSPFGVSSRFDSSVLLAALVFILSLSKSLAAKSIVYTTSLSVASYLAWLVMLSRSYGANPLWLSSLSHFRRGVLWSEISSVAFACTTAMTVPLSASLMAGTPSAPLASRNARVRSFELLNVLSTMLAGLLLLPVVITAASPRASTPSTTSDNLTLGLRVVTLVLSIPSVIVSILSLPTHGVAYRLVRTNLGLSIITLIILALSLVPPTIASTLDDVTLVMAVSGTFLLPALTHITIHYFRRPLSVVVPHEPSEALGTPSPTDSDLPPSPSRDPLLQRKERLLQRNRFGRRILWDIGVWIILIPICGCAFVWAAGRLTQRW